MIEDKKVFLVKCSLAHHTKFIVEAPDLLYASMIATKIVHSIDAKASIHSVEEFNISLIEWKEE